MYNEIFARIINRKLLDMLNQLISYKSCRVTSYNFRTIDINKNINMRNLWESELIYWVIIELLTIKRCLFIFFTRIYLGKSPYAIVHFCDIIFILHPRPNVSLWVWCFLLPQFDFVDCPVHIDIHNFSTWSWICMTCSSSLHNFLLLISLAWIFILTTTAAWHNLFQLKTVFIKLVYEQSLTNTFTLGMVFDFKVDWWESFCYSAKSEITSGTGTFSDCMELWILQFLICHFSSLLY